MEVLLSIGGSIASAVLHNLVGQVISDAIQQFGRDSGLQHELGMLRRTLQQASLFLNRAEKRRIKDGNLDQILQELRNAAYDAEDLLGEFEYQVLQQKAENQENQGGNFLSSSLTRARNLFNRDDAVARLREVMGNLDKFVVDMESVIRFPDLDDEDKKYQSSVRRETSSFLTEPEVFGREEEKEKVIKLLLESGDATEPRDDLIRVCSKRPKKDRIPVLPVVGIGGIGKTTFAQLVYNDPKVDRYFQLKIWVWVSDNFDVKRLTKEIIEFITEERLSEYPQNLSVLQRILEKEIKSKSFLLVLDDIWDCDSSKWHGLRAPLMSAGMEGSKILVTTRFPKVAKMMGTMETVTLEGLANDAYWKLFSGLAFGSQNPVDQHPMLEALGKKIAHKLKGSPLAAKTVGGLLNSDLSDRHWEDILNSELWQLKQGEDDIIPALHLSYQYLPAYLKQCVAYCSIFRKDHKYEKEKIVQMWTAQGFIVPEGNMRIEDVGSRYFDELRDRSFFEDSWKPTYVMHDLIHDLVQSVTVDTHLRIEDGKWQEIPGRVRHLSIYNVNLQQIKLMNFGNCNNLRTLVIENWSDENLCSMLHQLLAESTKIHVLLLRNRGITELPENIGNLKHLRYLDVSSMNIRRLPESLCNLYNLQVLNIFYCPWENLPTRLTNLAKLRHLKAHESICKLADIGKLTSLQELPTFAVAKHRGRKIGELKDMRQLHGRLRIENIEKVESTEEASRAELNNKSYLDELELVWSIDSGNADEVLEGLKPNSNLRMLKISRYGGVGFPSWLEPQLLKNLRRIVLENIQSCGQLPPLGQLPFLQILHIIHMHAVKQVGQEFYGSPDVKVFPLLEELVIWGMPEWEEWRGAQGIQVFPRLLELFIIDCPKLRDLPYLPPFLRKLHLENVGINILPESWNRDHDFNDGNRITQLHRRSSSRTSSISSMHIERCPNLVNLEQWLLLHHLPDIKKLWIITCQKVVQLPMQRFEDFRFLEILQIVDCPLTMPPMQPILIPSSLRYLKLGSCGHLDEALSGCQHNLTSLTTLELVRCPHITSLPGEVLGRMISLISLTILECGELRSLGDLRALRSLQYLTVRGCPRLTVSANEEDQSEYSASFSFLEIDNTGLLKVLFSATSLPSLYQLQIRDSVEERLWLPGLKSLQELTLENCTNLQSLPAELHGLSALKRFSILSCPGIRSLPENGLPSSIERVDSYECHPELTEQLERQLGNRVFFV